MSLCRNLDVYLDRRLSTADTAAFEQHLGGCASCQAEVSSWRQVESELKDWAAVQSPSSATMQAAAERLVRRARRAEAGLPGKRLVWAWGLGFAAAAATVIAVIVSGQVGRVPPKPLALSTVRGEGGSAREARGAILRGEGEGLLARIGPDVVGVSRNGRVEVLEAVESRVRMRLHAGSIALKVQHRTRGETVEIEARDLVVRVVGTRFMVSLTPAGEVRVGVEEGKVRVTAAGGRSVDVSAGEEVWSPTASSLELSRLPAGEARSLDELLETELPVARSVESPRPSFTSPPPMSKVRERPAVREAGRASEEEIALWQKQILAGAYDDAERALAQHLKLMPRDGEAWSLLGDSRRKAGRFKDAVKAYRQVIKVSDGAPANRARLLAASVLQDDLKDPRAAAPLLRAYLAASPTLKPLEAAAEVRLGRALAATGQAAAAENVLKGVINGYPGTPAAEDAQRELSQLGR